jgi:CHAT domain-containing protein
VRWLHGSWPPDRLRLRDVRYVIPDYPVETYVLPNAADERQFLEQELGAKPVTPQFKDVRDLLATPDGFDVVHFACHGDNDPEQIDARLMLQGRTEGNQYFPSLLQATVVSAVSRFAENGRRPIVVLNACQVGSQRLGLTTLGGFAQAFLGAGAGAFVAPLWSVGDREANVFARTFYSTLKAGKSMSEAAITAREAARAQPQADASWLAYAVYGYPHAQVEGG